ncbi:hypothetical protein ACH4YO_15855 [Streptomyces noursei]|uniref:hypothetical protein n=1 Tax=Streptomyces noursei TaxID=1971 RepID=UPI0033F8C844
MTKQPTNDAAIQQWNRTPREALEAMEPDGDFAKRHLIDPVLLRMLGDVRGRRILDAGGANSPSPASIPGRRAKHGTPPRASRATSTCPTS